MWEGIKSLFQYVNRLNPNIKTFVIFALLFMSTQGYWLGKFANLIECVNRDDTENADSYAALMAVEINKKVSDILNEDPEISNVILLSYHNSTHSLQGFSYLYLTALTEQVKGLDTKPQYEEWESDLKYTYYAEELDKIHGNAYLRIDNVNEGLSKFPKLGRKLKDTGITSAGFYPIKGLDSHIGMLLILYKDKKEYGSDYASKHVLPHMQVIASILDYQNVARRVENEHRQKKW